MRHCLAIIGLTLLALVGLDLSVAAVLDTRAPDSGIVRYFDYGRSVPGKLARWVAHPEAEDNLFDVAWRADLIAQEQTKFAAEQTGAPVVRGYGMSFTDHILRAAAEQDPGLRVDFLGGPQAPPNFAYALFLDDRAERRAGDVVVLGILSSSLPGMAALSNRTWAFEQPAPFTYPVFLPAPDGGLTRIEPLVESAAEERAAIADPGRAAAWEAQLARVDAFRTAAAFDLPALDVSPLMRLLRRDVTIDLLRRREQTVLAGFPYREVLSRMIEGFVATARADGQVPMTLLIQSNRPGDPDLLEIAEPVLTRLGAPYLATETLADPRDPVNFVPDGHYAPEVNRRFGRAFLDLLARPGLPQADARPSRPGASPS